MSDPSLSLPLRLPNGSIVIKRVVEEYQLRGRHLYKVRTVEDPTSTNSYQALVDYVERPAYLVQPMPEVQEAGGLQLQVDYPGQSTAVVDLIEEREHPQELNPALKSQSSEYVFELPVENTPISDRPTPPPEPGTSVARTFDRWKTYLGNYTYWNEQIKQWCFAQVRLRPKNWKP